MALYGALWSTDFFRPWIRVVLRCIPLLKLIAITKKNLILHLFGRNCRPKVPLVFITAAGIIENWKKKSGVSLKKIKKKKTKLLMKTLIYLNVN